MEFSFRGYIGFLKGKRAMGGGRGRRTIREVKMDIGIYE